MIRLDATTRKLQAVLSGAITTSQLPIVVSWSDKTSSTYSGGTTVINSNSTTAVDICAAPGASTNRDVDSITIYNADTVAATVAVRYNDNGTTYILTKVVMPVGATLKYTHAANWQMIDSTGNYAFSIPSTSWASPGAIGSVAPNTGAFTTLSTTGPITVSRNNSAIGASPLSGEESAIFIGPNAARSTVVNISYGSIAPFLSFRANGTQASPSAVQSGDLLGGGNCSGYKATGWLSGNSGGFGYMATENWNDTSCGTKLIFYTTSNGTTSIQSRGYVDHDGTLIMLGAITDSKGDVRLVPQNSQSAAYTLVLADAGKHILHPAADTTARTYTIPANASVAYPIGTAVTFVNQNAGGVITIAITTDTMRLAGAGTTGSRTLAANGIATALKITSTEWIISGTGLT